MTPSCLTVVECPQKRVVIVSVGCTICSRTWYAVNDHVSPGVLHSRALVRDIECLSATIVQSKYGYSYNVTSSVLVLTSCTSTSTLAAAAHVIVDVVVLLLRSKSCTRKKAWG